MQQSAEYENLDNLNINHSLGGAAEFNAVISNLISRVQTVTLVKVLAVSGTGVSPVGEVNVQPLVQMLDGAGNVYSPGRIFSVPYFRLQGGSNAVICDPVAGDIGLCAFASRDISAVKRNNAESAPGSRRQHDWNDGLYIGGFLNGTPQQYISFSDSGIVIHSPTSITLEAPSIKMQASAITTTTGSYAVNALQTAQFTGGGGISADGDVKAGSVSLQNHTHKGVTTGNGNTGKPNS